MKNHLDLENFKNAEFEGFKIYQLFYDSIYISQALKDKLVSECEKLNDLDFIREFPRYA